jgi:uncharacterized protein (TIGR00288 family)
MERTVNIAVYADFENIAIGARDANLEMNIDLVLERLLDKGSIVVKKAYCDWERYKAYRKQMHQAAFELIEIPHVSYAGKNSADIRMVVDALDLCYTKPHVDAFAILSGDSDFSPLVSKLRENAKMVIGVGVRSSSSDLLIDNCDDFIYYDDLVRRKKGGGRKSGPRSSKAPKKTVDKKTEALGKPEEALELVMEVTEALMEEREGNIWASMIKQTLKRKRPNFNESFYGYRTFTHLLQDAQKRGMLEIERDDKSRGFLVLGFGPKA